MKQETRYKISASLKKYWFYKKREGGYSKEEIDRQWEMEKLMQVYCDKILLRQAVGYIEFYKSLKSGGEIKFSRYSLK